jgi:septation ring formation regulator EzrA
MFQQYDETKSRADWIVQARLAVIRAQRNTVVIRTYLKG